MASYAKSLTPSPHEMHVLMKTCEPKMSLKTEKIHLFQIPRVLQGKYKRIDGKAIIRKAHLPSPPTVSIYLPLKKNTLSNTHMAPAPWPDVATLLSNHYH